MDLKFKAPTKKSSAEAHNKNLWRSEEDEELRSLYDQYRTEDGKFILLCFNTKKNKLSSTSFLLQIVYNEL